MPRDLATIEKQQEGHKLVDELVSMGVSRKWVYKRLESWRLQHSAHFADVKDSEDATKVIKCLKLMIKVKKEMKMIPKNYPYFLKENKLS